MDCPYCDVSAPRMSLHSHLADEHTEEIGRDGDATFVLSNPDGEDITVTLDAATADSEERFSNEVAVLAFDRLLDSIEG